MRQCPSKCRYPSFRSIFLLRDTFVHKYQIDSKFIFLQNDCKHEYNNINHFKKHLLNKHTNRYTTSIGTIDKSRHNISNLQINLNSQSNVECDFGAGESLTAS